MLAEATRVDKQFSAIWENLIHPIYAHGWQCCNLQTQADYCMPCRYVQAAKSKRWSMNSICRGRSSPATQSNLPLPDHVDSFVPLNGSPGRLEFSESLFGVYSTFDGLMILFEDAIQYCTGRCRQRWRSVPSFLLSGIAEL